MEGPLRVASKRKVRRARQTRGPFFSRLTRADVQWEVGYGKIEGGLLRVYESALGGAVLVGPLEYCGEWGERWWCCADLARSLSSCTVKRGLDADAPKPPKGEDNCQFTLADAGASVVGVAQAPPLGQFSAVRSVGWAHTALTRSSPRSRRPRIGSRLLKTAPKQWRMPARPWR